jgi:Ca2+-binding RTX toxin-like protein
MTIYITDDMLLDGVASYYGSASINMSGITIPVTFGYTPYNEDAYVAPVGMPDPQLNADEFQATVKLVLTNGDDNFGLVEGGIAPRIYGGDGNDSLSSSMYGPGTRLDGGNGDDKLYGLAPDRDHLLGEAGNDTLFVYAGDEATGGAGADRFVVSDMNGASAFLCDVSVAQHDVVDLWQPLASAGYAHSYASFAQAEAAGTLGVRYDHGYTYLSFDTDKDHVPDHEFAHIKGVILPDQLDQTFLVSYEQSYYHQAGYV